MKPTYKYEIFALTWAVIFLFAFRSTVYSQRAFGQLQTLAGTTVNVPDVNGPVPVGGTTTSGTSSSDNNAYHMTSADYDREISSFMNEQGEKENEKGVEAFNNGNYKKALRLFRTAKKYLPNNSTINQNIANAEQKLQDAKDEKEREANLAKEAEESKRLAEERAKAIEKQRLEVERNNRNVAEKEISAAIAEIANTKKQITHIQGMLRMYSADLQRNTAEFENWQKTVDQTLQGTISTSKEYIEQMFVKYGLLKALDPKMRVAIYNKFGKYLSSSNPEVQKWILKQCTSANVNVDQMEDIVNAVNLDKDLIEIVLGDKGTIKQNLNTTLFIYNFLEASHWVDMKGIMTKRFPGAPGDYFEQAKMIGEVYGDLAMQCYSWYSINWLSNNTEEKSEQVKTFSANMEYQEKKMGCLHSCLENCVNNNCSSGCVNGCTGKSRFTSPVPPL